MAVVCFVLSPIIFIAIMDAGLARNLHQQFNHHRDSLQQTRRRTHSKCLSFSGVDGSETRKVSFPSEMTAVIPDPTSASSVDFEQFWYLQDELTLFRSQARDMCRHMRNFTNISLCTLSWDNMENKCDTRGLEQRSCLERQRRKFITNKFILKASHELSADRLAELTTKVTAWAVELAVQEAIRDFHRAYSCPESNTAVKRQHSSDEESRNLKPRST